MHTDINRQCQLEVLIQVAETFHHCPSCKTRATSWWHDGTLLKLLAHDLLCISFAGTGTLKQTKGHGLSSSDELSKSASLPEPVGTLSSTSLGHNHAADGAQSFYESADNFTSTSASDLMTGQAVLRAVTVQVNLVSAQPLFAFLSGSQSVCSFVSMLVHLCINLQ